METCKHELGKRTRLTPTRAGVVSETYLICYYCSEEFSELETNKGEK